VLVATDVKPRISTACPAILGAEHDSTLSHIDLADLYGCNCIVINVQNDAAPLFVYWAKHLSRFNGRVPVYLARLGFAGTNVPFFSDSHLNVYC